MVASLQGKSAINENTKKAITFSGKQYGVPFWTETQVLYYRKDLLANAGYTEPPKTWDELREMGKKLTDTSKGLYGIGMGYGKGNSDAEFLTRGIIWSYGGSVDTQDGKTVIADSPETVQAASFIRDIFLTDKSTPPSAIGWDDAGNNKAYLSGQAAMIFNTGSVLATIKKDNPDLYEKTGIAPYPAGPKGTFIPGISNNLGIFKDSKNKDLAKKFISYMLDKDWYKSWIEKGAPLTAPVYDELAKEAVWQGEKTKPLSNPLLALISSAILASTMRRRGKCSTFAFSTIRSRSCCLNRATRRKRPSQICRRKFKRFTANKLLLIRRRTARAFGPPLPLSKAG